MFQDQNAQAVPSRMVIVSSMDGETRTSHPHEAESESYAFAAKAFFPLLARWGQTASINRAESRIDFAIARARQQGREPAHVSFLPLHLMYLTAQAPNIAYAFCEFPEIPTTGFNNNPRNNWLRIADRLTTILTANPTMRDAFMRAGVKTPVYVVPVPIDDACFEVPDWRPGQRVAVDCPACVFPQQSTVLSGLPDPWTARSIDRVRTFPKFCYRKFIEPLLPDTFNDYVRSVVRALFPRPEERPPEYRYQVSKSIELAGIVYTAFVNPFDRNSNWQDLLSAFVLGLSDQDDAMLVVKLAAAPKWINAAQEKVFKFYRTLGSAHRCKVAITTGELTDQQMWELMRGTAYFVNTSQADGGSLPMQAFLAAGRPAIAAAQATTAGYFSGDVGFAIEAHPEPAWWPNDSEEQLVTVRQRLVWSSLVSQLRASHAAASKCGSDYRGRAEQGRTAMAGFTADRVWPLLAAALQSACSHNQSSQPAVQGVQSFPLSKAV